MDHALTIPDGPQEASLVDGGGARPGYSLRTLCRALAYTRSALSAYGLQRALYDGAAMAFLTQLAPGRAPRLEALLRQHLLPSVTNLKARRSHSVVFRLFLFVEGLPYHVHALQRQQLPGVMIKLKAQH